MKILWLTNIPSPYRVNFFNEFGKQCELTVLFEKRRSQEREESWENHNFINFKGIIMNGWSTSVDSACCPEVKKYLKKNYDNIIVTNYSTLTGMLAIYCLKRKKIPFTIEVDGGFPKSGKGFKEKIKKYLISSAETWLSTSKVTDEYLMMYGAKKDKIIRYPFTSIYRKEILDKPVESEEKRCLKDKLGIVEEKAILTVGQFIHRKGFDLLLQVATQLKEKNIGFYFVGGEATSEYMDIKNKEKLERVHFVGFKSKDELAEYYKAMDIFVLPTREDIWGLVINEAMACGLPIITTDRCIAGLELVQNGVNGYIVPVDNIEELKNKIENLVVNSEKYKEISKNNLALIGNYTIEKMAEIHRLRLN